MKIEEKVKAYDKALERAKEIINYYKERNRDEAAIEDIQEIFPELKESKDERVRKSLISYLHGLDEFDYPDKKTYHDWLGWLEKQGEHLENYDEAEKEKADFVGNKFIECHANFLDFKEGNIYWLEYIGDDKYNVRSDNLLGKTYHITPCQLYTIFKKQTWIEKQDQKETVWNKEDEENMNNVLYILNQLKDTFFYKEDDTSEKIINWFKSLKNRVCSNNEYDKDILGAIEYCINNNRPLEKEHIAWLKKQDEQNEPKFRKGEWITNNQYVKLVVGIGTKGNIPYYYMFKDGTTKTIDDIDKKWHLWTIKDAKNGDVLVDEDNNIGIYNKVVYNKEKDNLWESYIYLGCDNYLRGFNNIGGYHIYKNTKPATIEQYDLLFQKIKEAGYKWDANKKELKKIIDEKQIKKNLQDNSFRRMFEQKREWSEEDEHRIKDTLYFLDTAKKHYASTVELDACITWLKSLKDLNKCSYTFNETDKEILNAAILFAMNSTEEFTCNGVSKEDVITLLESIRQRIEE